MVSMKKKQIQIKNKITVVLIIMLLSLASRPSSIFSRPSSDDVRGMTDDGSSESQVTGYDLNLVWSTSYKESLEQAKLKKLPILIKFEASWCVWCEKMEEETFTDPEVKKELEKFVCVKIDVDKQVDIAKAYKIKSLPRTIVINIYDEIVGDWLGYHEAPAFSKLLRDVDEYTQTKTGTTSIPEIQQVSNGSSETIDFPAIDPNNTNDLIGLLGHKNAGINQRIVELLVKSGPKILPDVVPALEGKYLGTRIAAWKVVSELTGKKYKYDPWSSRTERIQAAEQIKKELQSTSL